MTPERLRDISHNARKTHEGAWTTVSTTAFMELCIGMEMAWHERDIALKALGEHMRQDHAKRAEGAV